jgi:hypothetical protein
VSEEETMVVEKKKDGRTAEGKAAKAASETDKQAEQEAKDLEKAREYTGIGRSEDPHEAYIVWDTVNHTMVAGPFDEEEQADAARERAETHSVSYADEQLQVESLTVA